VARISFVAGMNTEAVRKIHNAMIDHRPAMIARYDSPLYWVTREKRKYWDPSLAKDYKNAYELD
jgi:hypothetical protein